MSSNSGAFVNRVGLSRKHIFDAVEASVERLGTYIDVLQIHRLDRDTPPREIMKALNDVVERGLVRYIGASSMACWEFQNLQVCRSFIKWLSKTKAKQEKEEVVENDFPLPTRLANQFIFCDSNRT